MKNIDECAYWVGLAHLPRWKTSNINKLIVSIIKDKQLQFSDFFDMGKESWINEFQLTDRETDDLETAKSDLPNYAFLVEDLLNQGFDIIPLTSPYYSKVLKGNLKLKYAPPVLYTKGNKDLLNEGSIAIVGSRKAKNVSLDFTENIVKNAVKSHQIIVSGFAKGVDRKALDETLKHNGRSIIVLPQGILTFASSIKKYYSKLIDGDILILSTYHPKVPWSIGLAMGRNKYIYGLAEDIYVAESDQKGGTWTGAQEGLKKGQRIFVRRAKKDEGNGNNQLIENGATPVDINGKTIKGSDESIDMKTSQMKKDNPNATNCQQTFDLD